MSKKQSEQKSKAFLLIFIVKFILNQTYFNFENKIRQVLSKAKINIKK